MLGLLFSQPYVYPFLDLFPPSGEKIRQKIALGSVSRRYISENLHAYKCLFYPYNELVIWV